MEFKTIQELEKEQISKVLHFTDGDKSKASKILGISKATIYRKIDEYGINDKGEACIGRENISQGLTLN